MGAAHAFALNSALKKALPFTRTGIALCCRGVPQNDYFRIQFMNGKQCNVRIFEPVSQNRFYLFLPPSSFFRVNAARSKFKCRIFKPG